VREPSQLVNDLLGEHRRIALDANVLIYLLDGRGERAKTAAALVDAAAAGEVEGVIASIGLVETLVGPARVEGPARFEQVAATIRDLGLRFIPLTAEIAEDAAWIRGASGLGLPDSIHLATARAAGATVFVTNDRRIRPRPHLDVRYVDDLAASDDLP
jgi:predicted nucleic acid-binding protein